MDSSQAHLYGHPSALTRQKVSRLLGVDSINLSSVTEEQHHQWSVNESQRLDCPLLRVWDCYSGSQLEGPEQDGRMLSRSPEESLDTTEARKDSLASHLNHKNWNPTPYISFTKSASAVEDLAANRISRGRGEQTITVIDPATRFRKGLPILDVMEEMDYYSIQDPYRKGRRYYINHYVCLWEVTKEEIVGHWKWETLKKIENWYEEVIMPAFNLRRDQRRAIKFPLPPSPPRESTFDMSTLRDTLPGEPSAHTTLGQQVRSSTKAIMDCSAISLQQRAEGPMENSDASSNRPVPVSTMGSSTSMTKPPERTEKTDTSKSVKKVPRRWTIPDYVLAQLEQIISEQGDDADALETFMTDPVKDFNDLSRKTVIVEFFLSVSKNPGYGKGTHKRIIDGIIERLDFKDTETLHSLVVLLYEAPCDENMIEALIRLTEKTGAK